MGIPVLNYPDYTVSEKGEIFSRKSNRILKHNITNQGYHTVELFNKHGSKRLLVHRLVAQAYVPNPENLPQVNHINENKGDNSARNLEWCTAKYNMNYGEAAKTRHKKIDYSTESRKSIARRNGKAVSRPVLQIMNGEVVNRFESAKQASVFTGISHSHICEAASGKAKTAGGFTWLHERRSDLSGFQS